MKTLIAVPCMDTVHTAFADALLRMDKPPDTHVLFLPGSLIYDARNQLSLIAIQNGCDAVLWLDSDIIPPQDTLVRMHERMEQGYQMVTGLYFKRTMPTAPVIYSKVDQPDTDEHGRFRKRIIEYRDYPHDTFFKVAGCGFGCVMTRTDLLSKLWDTAGPPFAPFPWAGEDIAFCYRANHAGETIYCDSSIRCKHIGTFAYTEELYTTLTGGDQYGRTE